LQTLNKIRVPWIKTGLLSAQKENVDQNRPLKDLRLLDVGCGGGLLTEVST